MAIKKRRKPLSKAIRDKIARGVAKVSGPTSGFDDRKPEPKQPRQPKTPDAPTGRRRRGANIPDPTALNKGAPLAKAKPSDIPNRQSVAHKNGADYTPNITERGRTDRTPQREEKTIQDLTRDQLIRGLDYHKQRGNTDAYNRLKDELKARDTMQAQEKNVGRMHANEELLAKVQANLTTREERDREAAQLKAQREKLARETKKAEAAAILESRGVDTSEFTDIDPDLLNEARKRIPELAKADNEARAARKVARDAEAAKKAQYEYNKAEAAAILESRGQDISDYKGIDPDLLDQARARLPELEAREKARIAAKRGEMDTPDTTTPDTPDTPDAAPRANDRELGAAKKARKQARKERVAAQREARKAARTTDTDTTPNTQAREITPPKKVGNNTVDGGGHQASEKYLTEVRSDKGYGKNLDKLKERLASDPDQAEKFNTAYDKARQRAETDHGDPATNRHAQREELRLRTLGEDAGLFTTPNRDDQDTYTPEVADTGDLMHPTTGGKKISETDAAEEMYGTGSPQHEKAKATAAQRKAEQPEQPEQAPDRSAAQANARDRAQRKAARKTAEHKARTDEARRKAREAREAKQAEQPEPAPQAPATPTVDAEEGRRRAAARQEFADMSDADIAEELDGIRAAWGNDLDNPNADLGPDQELFDIDRARASALEDEKALRDMDDATAPDLTANAPTVDDVNTPDYSDDELARMEADLAARDSGPLDVGTQTMAELEDQLTREDITDEDVTAITEQMEKIEPWRRGGILESALTHDTIRPLKAKIKKFDTTNSRGFNDAEDKDYKLKLAAAAAGNENFRRYVPQTDEYEEWQSGLMSVQEQSFAEGNAGTYVNDLRQEHMNFNDLVTNDLTVTKMREELRDHINRNIGFLPNAANFQRIQRGERPLPYNPEGARELGGMGGRANKGRTKADREFEKLRADNERNRKAATKANAERPFTQIDGLPDGVGVRDGRKAINWPDLEVDGKRDPKHVEQHAKSLSDKDLDTAIAHAEEDRSKYLGGDPIVKAYQDEKARRATPDTAGQDTLDVTAPQREFGARGQQVNDVDAAEEMYGTNSPEHHRAKVQAAKDTYGENSPEHQQAIAAASKPRPKDPEPVDEGPKGEQGTLAGIEDTARASAAGDTELPGLDAVALKNPTPKKPAPKAAPTVDREKAKAKVAAKGKDFKAKARQKRQQDRATAVKEATAKKAPATAPAKKDTTPTPEKDRVVKLVQDSKGIREVRTSISRSGDKRRRDNALRHDNKIAETRDKANKAYVDHGADSPEFHAADANDRKARHERAQDRLASEREVMDELQKNGGSQSQKKNQTDRIRRAMTDEERTRKEFDAAVKKRDDAAKKRKNDSGGGDGGGRGLNRPDGDGMDGGGLPDGAGLPDLPGGGETAGGQASYSAVRKAVIAKNGRRLNGADKLKDMPDVELAAAKTKAEELQGKNPNSPQHKAVVEAVDAELARRGTDAPKAPKANVLERAIVKAKGKDFKAAARKNRRKATAERVAAASKPADNTADDLAYSEVAEGLRTPTGAWRKTPNLRNVSDDNLARAHKVNEAMAKKGGYVDEVNRMMIAIAEEQDRRTSKPDHNPGQAFTKDHLIDGEDTGGNVGTHTIRTGSKKDISITTGGDTEKYEVSRTIPTGGGKSITRKQEAATLDEARNIAKTWNDPKQRKIMEDKAKSDAATREARTAKSARPDDLTDNDRKVLAKAYPGKGGSRGPDIENGLHVRKLDDAELAALSKIRDRLPDHHGDIIDAEVKRRKSATKEAPANKDLADAQAYLKEGRAFGGLKDNHAQALYDSKFKGENLAIVDDNLYKDGRKPTKDDYDAIGAGKLLAERGIDPATGKAPSEPGVFALQWKARGDVTRLDDAELLKAKEEVGSISRLGVADAAEIDREIAKRDLAPKADSGDTIEENPDADIIIEHTPDGGTIIHGTSRNDGTADILKANGLKWSRNLGAWYVGRSRDKRPDMAKIRQIQKALADGGHDVGLDVDKSRRSAADIEASRTDRANDRATAMRDKADRKAAKAEQAESARKAALDQVPPMGEPIKVGHHSEQRHRRSVDKAWNALGKSVEADREADRAAYKARIAEAANGARHAPSTVRNRANKLAADVRRWQRELDKGATGARKEQLEELIADGTDDRDFWQGVRDKQIADGIAFDTSTIKAGDQISGGGSQWYTVTKVNKETLTVTKDGDTPVKVSIDSVKKHRAEADVPAGSKVDTTVKDVTNPDGSVVHKAGSRILKKHLAPGETLDAGKIKRGDFFIRNRKGESRYQAVDSDGKTHWDYYGDAVWDLREARKRIDRMQSDKLALGKNSPIIGVDNARLEQVAKDWDHPHHGDARKLLEARRGAPSISAAEKETLRARRAQHDRSEYQGSVDALAKNLQAVHREQELGKLSLFNEGDIQRRKDFDALNPVSNYRELATKIHDAEWKDYQDGNGGFTVSLMAKKGAVAPASNAERYMEAAKKHGAFPAANKQSTSPSAAELEPEVHYPASTWNEPYSPDERYVVWNGKNPLEGSYTWQGANRNGTYYAAVEKDSDRLPQYAKANSGAKRLGILADKDSIDRSMGQAPAARAKNKQEEVDDIDRLLQSIDDAKAGGDTLGQDDAQASRTLTGADISPEAARPGDTVTTPYGDEKIIGIGENVVTTTVDGKRDSAYTFGWGDISKLTKEGNLNDQRTGTDHYNLTAGGAGGYAPQPTPKKPVDPMNPGTFYTRKQLTERGWTKAQIDKEIGTFDTIARRYKQVDDNGEMFHNIRTHLFNRDRVHLAEKRIGKNVDAPAGKAAAPTPPASNSDEWVPYHRRPLAQRTKDIYDDFVVDGGIARQDLVEKALLGGKLGEVIRKWNTEGWMEWESDPGGDPDKDRLVPTKLGIEKSKARQKRAQAKAAKAAETATPRSWEGSAELASARKELAKLDGVERDGDVFRVKADGTVVAPYDSSNDPGVKFQITGPDGKTRGVETLDDALDHVKSIQSRNGGASTAKPAKPVDPTAGYVLDPKNPQPREGRKGLAIEDLPRGSGGTVTAKGRAMVREHAASLDHKDLIQAYREALATTREKGGQTAARNAYSAEMDRRRLFRYRDSGTKILDQPMDSPAKWGMGSEAEWLAKEYIPTREEDLNQMAKNYSLALQKFHGMTKEEADARVARERKAKGSKDPFNSGGSTPDVGASTPEVKAPARHKKGEAFTADHLEEGEAPARHKKGEAFTADHLEEGEALNKSGSIQRGEFKIIPDKEGYRIMEGFGNERMSKVHKRTLGRVRQRVDAMQKQRDANK